MRAPPPPSSTRRRRWSRPRRRTDVGTSHYEPVDQLLGTDRYPGLHVVYNDVATLDLVIDDETAMLDRDRDLAAATRRSPTAELGDPRPRFIGRSTRIVLDGDRTYFAANPATAFSRQLAIFNDFTLLYELIEPLSVENPESVRWRLDLSVKGQEVWVSGGPTTTDNNTLVAELTAPGYFLLDPVTDKELHLFFVGYDVANVFGQAAGIGTAAGGLGGRPAATRCSSRPVRVRPRRRSGSSQRTRSGT